MYSEIHTPVLLNETIDGLNLSDFQGPKIIVDATLGLGGHAGEVVKQLGAEDSFIGIDAEMRNLEDARKHIEGIAKGMSGAPRLHFVQRNFGDIDTHIKSLGIENVTHIYADLGVSSRHFDDAEGGFSHRIDAPLDMRLDRGTPGKTAKDILASYSDQELANLFRKYADESRAWPLAKGIVQLREEAPYETTFQLVNTIETYSRNKKSIARIFQALRIEVNKEYEMLEELIIKGLPLLSSGGICGIITFHSGEDRIVKHIFRDVSQDEIDDLTGQISKKAPFSVINRKPILPTQEEIEKNPRARSAKLRFIQKDNEHSSTLSHLSHLVP